MTNRIDIQEFINNAPENIVGSLNHPEAVTADMLDNIPHRYSSNLVCLLYTSLVQIYQEKDILLQLNAELNPEKIRGMHYMENMS